MDFFVIGFSIQRSGKAFSHRIGTTVSARRGDVNHIGGILRAGPDDSSGAVSQTTAGTASESAGSTSSR
jgi:hypothetical protein